MLENVTYHFQCFCDQTHAWVCGAGATAASIALLVIIFYCLKKRAYWKKKTQESERIEAFLKNHGPMAVKRYKYKQVKKMTQSFKEKLGQGGYGCVFKGKLPNGRHVAVKILKDSDSNGEDFINEVSSISKTSHVNIVTLLGFCFEGSKRTLIFEFMSNGSLEKHIFEKNSSPSNREFGWETLYEITLGIAHGLEYLHRGCNTRILHFDIKPHNILLDENFCPKISDFGLAKICPGRESIISMMDMRGTIGYIAPEVICKKFGGVSCKSDVYSYGMLVLEMVGAKKSICVGVDHRSSEIYFPDWIYKRLELDEEVGLNGIENEEEKQIARKLIIVSLWCIQTNPSKRPSMGKVVEMLVGSVESLTIPTIHSSSGSSIRVVSNFTTTTEHDTVL
ncbi:LEAF RUST 10 DISEASE-RESISTANCE LOCUS RECEPTOR-LIKE PROTEIN KINASE-like 2.1 [Mercurialis annua]|uniref:LEAF RUST 10 DISEASE-RESISTANCE LOCUS RECEPTOR-LIKE PROTEIN KINASE-like 2.1 n=1 Tax=Mercurialis annua TaxID=3986 RepID=UPI0021600021|nr:LEAF RUST 10 DISEASE-RESISTANCE LOCUS RECEPTOR-LIKE PROTEIN KINASE-like 2.1 [Mercurialis annua]